MSALTGEKTSPQPRENRTQTVKNDGWWPDIDMPLLRDSVRLPSGVTDKRLVQRTRQVILSVNNELAAWKEARRIEGYARPQDIPIKDAQGIVYDEHPLVTHYLAAVYAELYARLNEQYRATDTTGKGDKNAQMLDPSVAEGYRDKAWEVSAILDFNVAAHPQASVELI